MMRMLWWGAVLGLVMAGLLRAEETQAEPSIEALVRQLDAEEFSARQKASAALIERGQEALPALIEAASSDSAEISTRAIEILRQHFQGDQRELKAAATAALQKLSTGEGAAARSAAEILKPKPVAGRAPVAVAPMPFAPARVRVLGPGGVRIAVVAGKGAARRMSVKNIDGLREIEVVEAERTIIINEDRAKAIKMKVTTKQDGKEEAKEYEADSAEHLKAKHPEAFKLYEQYAKQDEGAAVLIRPDRPVIVREPRAIREHLDKAQLQLDEAAAQLQKRMEATEKDDQLRKIVEAMEAAKKEVEQARERFPK